MARFLIVLLVLIAIVSFVAEESEGFWRRRRRRRLPCVAGQWNRWYACSSNGCLTGYRLRYRSPICAGDKQYMQESCKGYCPVLPCRYNSWSNSGGCSTNCGTGSQLQLRYISFQGSTGCNYNKRRYTGCTRSNTCGRDCVMNNWSGYNRCDAGCSPTGYRYRYRSIKVNAVPPGKACTPTKEQLSCTGGGCCTRSNCLVNAWSGYSRCNANCGTGTQVSTRSILRSGSCGGTSCSGYNFRRTTSCSSYANQNCQVNAWGGWGSCSYSSGSCGSGIQYRRRYVRVAAVCRGAGCPSSTSSRSCSRCCPQNCAMNTWSGYSGCTASCGTGYRYRRRYVRTAASCGGSCSGSTTESTGCSNYVKRDCTLGPWKPYTACTSQCGTGTKQRTRAVVAQATCGGSCPPTSQTTSCTIYANKNCQLGPFGPWTACNAKCSAGTQYSYQPIIKPAVCRGTCATLAQRTKTQTCQPARNCQQLCNNGICSCLPGYYLSTNQVSCIARSCGKPTLPSICPSGLKCLVPTLSCPGGYTYSQSCSLTCPSLYILKGGSASILCQSSTVWTSYSSVYCTLRNQAPTKVSLSYVYLNENAPRGTRIGTFTTTDPNPSDTHTYLLTGSAGGKFRLVGSSLVTANWSPDYENGPISYSVTVKSTDQGGLSVSGTFTIYIRNVNEKPLKCVLTPDKMRENPSLDLTVGKLTTSDPDAGQNFKYSIINSAGSRFKVIGDNLKVALSNARCLADGYAACLYNYESSTQNKFTVVVRTTDSGSPPLSTDCTLTIDTTDVNDQPRNLQLSGYTLKEGAAVGTQVGTLSAFDEDTTQSITYTMVDSDSGRFTISRNKFVVNSQVANYETQTSHHITVRATDSGSPALYVEKSFSITVLDVKEAPVSMSITSSGGQQTYPDDKPTINENSLKNAVLGTIVARDPDAGAKLTFTLDNNAGGRFELDQSSVHCFAITNLPGVLTECDVRVLVSGTLNHEVDSLHTIVVRATDNHGLFRVQRFIVKILDQNDVPHDITTVGLLQIKENLNNVVIASFMTSDEDAAHTHAYKLIANPGNKFKIVGSRLMTVANANLNYEAQSSYTIVVRSTDNGVPAQYFDKTFTVTVLDVNEVPTSVLLNPTDVNENSPIDTVVGQLSTVDPDNVKSVRQVFTYTLKDSSAGRFKLDGPAVKVAVSNVDCLKYGRAYCKLNYEADATLSVDVLVTDSGSPPLSKNFRLTIRINNINDQPRQLALNNTIVIENLPIGTVVGYFSYTDEDKGQGHTMQLLNDDNGQFKLSSDGMALLKAKSANYETKQAHTVTVKVTDNGSPPLSMTRSFSISVVDVNEAPFSMVFKDTNGQHSFPDNHATIDENSKPKTIIGAVQASDPDANQQLVFSLDDDADGLFAIAPVATCSFVSGSVCSAAVTVFGSLDHEDTNVESIVVRVKDPGGHFKVMTFSIFILDINDAPTNVSLAGGNPTVPENKVDAFVGAFQTRDDDPRQTFTYTLVYSANGRFRIQGDELFTVGALDYEQTPTLRIRVRSTDSGTPPLYFEQNFIITVIDINEKPTMIHTSNHQIDENIAANTDVGTLSTTDPDNSGKTVWQTFTYAMLDNAGGRFKLDSNKLKVRASNIACLAVGGTKCWLNYEVKPIYTLLIRATDSGSPPLSSDFFINVTLKDINDRPRNLQLSNYRVHENQPVGTVIGYFSGSDEDKLQHLTYVLVDDDNGRFKIVGNQLQKAQAANFETQQSHSITVTMKDDGTPSLNITETFAIEVLDVHEAPVSTDFLALNGQLTFSKNSPEVEENVVSGTVVGTIMSIDADYNQTLTFRLDDDANGLFALSSAVSCSKVTDITGHHSACQVQLLVAGHLDFETTTQHNIVVRTIDQSGLFNVARFTIKVVDANDVPHDIQILAHQIDENSLGKLVTAFTTSDADKSHTHIYSLVTNPSGQFAIVNNSLYTSPAATLNYEAQQDWNITIRSMDNGVPPLYIDESFIIYVEDINEAPSKINITGSKIAENSPAGTVVGELQVTDPDNFGPKGRWQNASCIATDNADGIFIVVNNIVKVAQPSIDYEMNKSFTMSVTCTDDGLPPLTTSWTFTITVLNRNEPPTAIAITNDKIRENMPAGSVIGLFNTTDPDNADGITQTFTYSFVHALAGLPFRITGNQLRTTRPLNYEANPSWGIVVQSTDSGALSALHTFQISVIDINEPPTAFQLIAAGYVPEGSPYATYVGDVLAVDQDANQSHTFEVVAVAAGIQLNTSSPDASLNNAFLINPTSGVLSVGKVTLDYEVTAHYTLWIETTDHGLVPSLRFVDTVIVNVTDLNEAPVNITLSNAEALENSPVGTVVGSLTVDDPDNYGIHAGSQTFNCSVLDAQQQSFKVVNGLTLVVSKDNLDFENEEVHDIEIQCWDSDKISPRFLDKQFNITLINVNEAPINIRLSNLSIPEELTPPAELGVLTAVDPDNEVMEIQNMTFGLIPSNTSNVPFAISSDKISVVTTETLDYEQRSMYTLDVTVVDTGTPQLTSKATFSIMVENINDPPTGIVLNSSGILETAPIGTVIGTLSTRDEDRNQLHTYRVLTIVNISDNTMFGIRGNELILLTTVDYETEDLWPVLIETTDNGSPPLSHQDIINVTILNVNEAPTEIEIDYNTTVKEHSPAGAFVANLTVVDPDVNQTHTCYLESGQQEFILVNATIVGEGEITLEVASHAKLNYEATPFIQVTINCSDDGYPPLSISKTIVVGLEDVNDPPTAVFLSGNHNVSEAAPVGYDLGLLTAEDADRGQVYTYALYGEGSDIFTVNEALGRVQVENTGALDYEALTHPQLSLIVEVADNGDPSLKFNQTINITIIDVNEPPTNITLLGSEVLAEDAPVGTIVGQFYVENPEKTQTVKFDIAPPSHPEGSPTFGVYTNNTGSYLQLVDLGNTSARWLSDFIFNVNATDNGSPPEIAFGVVEVDVQYVDPCSTGTLKCVANATCTRLNSTAGQCGCNFGFVFDADAQSCMNLDDCHIPAASVNLSPGGNGAVSGAPKPTSAVFSLIPICQNNATCIDQVQNFQCICPPLYTGEDCGLIVDRCNTPTPFCQNGGQCINSIPQLTCACTLGYKGSVCQTNINDCLSNPCATGTCVDGVGNYTCQCPEHTTGSNCEYIIDACASAQCAENEQCAPKKIDLNAAAGEGAPVISGAGESFQPSSLDYYCIPQSQWDVSQFVNGSLTPAEKKAWKLLLLTTRFEGDGEMVYPDDVYLDPLPAVDGGLKYVVLVDGAPAHPTLVNGALQKQCAQKEVLPILTQSLCSRWMGLAKVLPTGDPTQERRVGNDNAASSSFSNTSLIWVVVGGLAAAALIVTAIVTTRFFFARKKVLERQGGGRHERVLGDDLAEEHAQGVMYDDTYATLGRPNNTGGGSAVFVQNPLYHNPMADIYGTDNPDQQVANELYDGLGNDYDQTQHPAEQPPINSTAADYDKLERDGDMDELEDAYAEINAHISQATDGGLGCRNPMFDESAGEDDGEGTYDEPRFGQAAPESTGKASAFSISTVKNPFKPAAQEDATKQLVDNMEWPGL